MPEEKPKCPECDTELVLVEDKPPQKCPKCGFLLQGFGQFERWVKAATKRSKKKATSQTDDDDSPFAALGKIL